MIGLLEKHHRRIQYDCPFECFRTNRIKDKYGNTLAYKYTAEMRYIFVLRKRRLKQPAD